MPTCRCKVASKVTGMVKYIHNIILQYNITDDLDKITDNTCVDVCISDQYYCLTKLNLAT